MNTPRKKTTATAPAGAAVRAPSIRDKAALRAQLETLRDAAKHGDVRAAVAGVIDALAASLSED